MDQGKHSEGLTGLDFLGVMAKTSALDTDTHCPVLGIVLNVAAFFFFCFKIANIFYAFHLYKNNQYETT